MPEYSIPRQIWRVIYPLLIFLGMSFVVIFFGSIIASVVIVLRDGIDPDAVAQALASFILEYGLWFDLVSSVLLIILFALMWRKIRLKLPNYDNTKANILTITLTVLAFVGLNYFLVSIFEITNLMQYFPSYDEIAEILGSGSFLVRILALGIAAPIVEEIVCRGIILNRLLAWMPKVVAVLVGSALFGLIHFNLLQSLYAFVLGIAFSLIYLRNRNLWIPIIAHMAFNLANVILTEIIEMTGAEISVWILLIPSTLVTALCVLLLVKRTTAASLVTSSNTETDANNVPLSEEQVQ